MPEPITMAIAAGAASLPVLVRAITELTQQGKYEEAERIRLQASKRFNIDLPPVEHMTPALQGASAFEGLREDQGLRNVEQAALSRMMGISQQGGWSPQDVARMELANHDAMRMARGMEGATNRNLQQRGLAGSGVAASMAMQREQGALERARMGGLQAQSSAADRALQMLMSGAGYASSLQNAGWARGAQRAGAMDAVSRFNAGQNQQAGLFNAGATGRHFDRQMKRAGAQYDADMGYAHGLQGDADRAVQTWSDVAEGAGKAVQAGAAGYYGMPAQPDVWDTESVKPPKKLGE